MHVNDTPTSPMANKIKICYKFHGYIPHWKGFPIPLHINSIIRRNNVSILVLNQNHFRDRVNQMYQDISLYQYASSSRSQNAIAKAIKSKGN